LPTPFLLAYFKTAALGESSTHCVQCGVTLGITPILQVVKIVQMIVNRVRA
jgi:hypothetical protein